MDMAMDKARRPGTTATLAEPTRRIVSRRRRRRRTPPPLSHWGTYTKTMRLHSPPRANTVMAVALEQSLDLHTRGF